MAQALAFDPVAQLRQVLADAAANMDAGHRPDGCRMGLRDAFNRPAGRVHIGAINSTPAPASAMTARSGRTLARRYGSGCR